MMQYLCRLTALFLVCTLLMTSSVHMASVFRDQDVDILDTLLDSGIAPIDKRRMGWALCNSMFKWRCGKSKTIHRKRNLVFGDI